MLIEIVLTRAPLLALRVVELYRAESILLDSNAFQFWHKFHQIVGSSCGNFRRSLERNFPNQQTRKKTHVTYYNDGQIK